MPTTTLNPVDTGLEVLDLRDNAEFAARTLHERNVATQMEGLRLLTHAFVESPFTILDVLVNAAVDLCGADSAGISLERDEKTRTDADFYQWVATAGDYSHFTNAILPREPSACGLCLHRRHPQLFRVTPRFFEIMGVQAKPVTDGLLLPWEVEDIRGTIWIMAHGREEAFDSSDVRLMEVLADFAAMAIRHQRQQLRLMEQAGASAAADMANGLAHQINNPLQCLNSLVRRASEGKSPSDASILARDLSPHLSVLSNLVTLLLSLPPAAGVTH